MKVVPMLGHAVEVRRDPLLLRPRCPTQWFKSSIAMNSTLGRWRPSLVLLAAGFSSRSEQAAAASTPGTKAKDRVGRERFRGRLLTGPIVNNG